MASKYPQMLVFIDIETSGLDMEKDQILEIAAVVTDFDLNKIAGYQEVFKLESYGADRIRANEYVLNMHRQNGLLKEAIESTHTLAEAEREIISMLQDSTTFGKGEFMIAGSGNAAFDFPWLKRHMPELASYFAYYPYDVGIFQRMVKMFNGGQDVIRAGGLDPNAAHRSLADVEYFIEKSRAYRGWVRAAEEATFRLGGLDK